MEGVGELPRASAPGSRALIRRRNRTYASKRDTQRTRANIARASGKASAPHTQASTLVRVVIRLVLVN